MSKVTHITAPNLIVVAGAFCHASIVGNVIHIAGTIGTRWNEETKTHELVKGGVGVQTKQVLENIATILKASGSCVHHLVKLNVFLKDNTPERYAQMNAAYVEFFKSQKADVCARITVGCGNLALGSDVEIDGVAFLPGKCPHAKLVDKQARFYNPPNGLIFESTNCLKICMELFLKKLIGYKKFFVCVWNHIFFYVTVILSLNLDQHLIILAQFK
ncbi:hypothetical protein RFI_25485 [Reticulomyxa filosa]|uniref:Uncharacterized protein n=1 Tax=Reticulomyxa filosa TaxID=46433 RepID=X6MES3_RETFI|nr:hypothetical protein RFI_25485 [Reticulomyxa filosa]|eukprot:ETO11892.1 hypothetical protein RFI_25485 [Reticulomyxa filosa]